MTAEAEPRVLDVRGCARCDADHPGLTFAPFAQPVEVLDGEVVFGWWAPCPTNGDPILLAIVEKPEDT